MICHRCEYAQWKNKEQTRYKCLSTLGQSRQMPTDYANCPGFKDTNEIIENRIEYKKVGFFEKIIKWIKFDV